MYCKLLNILLILIPSILGVNSIHAQQFEWLSNDFPGSRFLNVIDIEGKYYAIVSNGAIVNYDSSTIYQLIVYKLNLNEITHNIDLSEVNSIQFSDHFATNAIDFVPETKSWILVQSSYLSTNRHIFRIALYDENFNYITNTSIDTLGNPLYCSIDTYLGNTYIFGSIIGPPSDELLFSIYDHSNPHDLRSVQVKQSNPLEMFWVTSMQINHRTGNMLIFYYDGIAELDTNLHQTIIAGYPKIRTSDHGTAIGTNDNYYSVGTTKQGVGIANRFILFQKYDTLFNILNSDTFGIKGQDNYPFLAKSLDSQNNQFLIAGHLDGPLTDSDFTRSKKKYFLSKFDSEMNQLWYKEFGGDRAYSMFGIKLLFDGSSLAYGDIRDSIDGFRYAYILYLNPYGEIISSVIMPTPTSPSISVISPGNRSIQILNPDQVSARIILYDLCGYEILYSDISKSTECEILTNNLIPGIYPYVFISNGKILSRGKWLKID